MRYALLYTHVLAYVCLSVCLYVCYNIIYLAYYGARVVEHSQGTLQAPILEDMNYYLAFSCFRTAAILQGSEMR